MSTLNGKVCVITGGAGRIGGACVDRFTAAGGTVVAVDIVKVDLPDVDSAQCDLGDPTSIGQLEKTLKERYGRIDVLVNNGALGGQRCSFHEKPIEEYDAVMAVNVRAPFLLSQMAIRLHLDQPGRDLSIINVASVAGHKSALLASVYSTSKHALIGLTRNIATEYAQKRVKCNSVSPGIMEIPNIQGFTPDQVQTMTSKVPMQRGGKPSEVADVVYFLASDSSSYINGTDILVDGGSMGGSI